MDLLALRDVLSKIGECDSREKKNEAYQLLTQNHMDPRDPAPIEMGVHFVQTHSDIDFVGDYLSIHSHLFYELILCRNDCGVEYWVGSERFILQEGDILMVPPGTSHGVMQKMDSTVPYKRDILWISPHWMEIITLLTYGQTQPIQAHRIRTKKTKWFFLNDMFHKGVKLSNAQDFGWEAMVIANTTQLLIQLFKASDDEETVVHHDANPQLIDKVVQYLEENFTRQVSVPEIARQFFVSESTVSHAFPDCMGITVSQYLMQRRLIYAKDLIAQNIPLTQVGEKCGFMDYSTFYRAFKKEFGVSPSQYKRAMNMLPG